MRAAFKEAPLRFALIQDHPAARETLAAAPPIPGGEYENCTPTLLLTLKLSLSVSVSPKHQITLDRSALPGGDCPQNDTLAFLKPPQALVLTLDPHFPIFKEFLFPDRHDLLQPVDRIVAGIKRGSAMR